MSIKRSINLRIIIGKICEYNRQYYVELLKRIILKFISVMASSLATVKCLIVSFVSYMAIHSRTPIAMYE